MLCIYVYWETTLNECLHFSVRMFIIRVILHYSCLISMIREQEKTGRGTLAFKLISSSNKIRSLSWCCGTVTDIDPNPTHRLPSDLFWCTCPWIYFYMCITPGIKHCHRNLSFSLWTAQSNCASLCVCQLLALCKERQTLSTRFPSMYSGYGKYSDPLTFFTLCFIAAICCVNKSQNSRICTGCEPPLVKSIRKETQAGQV